MNDVSYRVMTHLGHILKVGDVALGYDLIHAVTDEDGVQALPSTAPDVILIRKAYGDGSGVSAQGSNSSKKRPTVGFGLASFDARKGGHDRKGTVDGVGKDDVDRMAFERELRDEEGLALELGGTEIEVETLEESMIPPDEDLPLISDTELRNHDDGSIDNMRGTAVRSDMVDTATIDDSTL